MFINPIATIQSPYESKFGIPRQSGLANSVESTIVFEPPYRHAEAIRGIEGFDYLWLIWQFSANKRADDDHQSLTVRPPRLGGNERVGVFASRSPFRPNGLGLSCVYINNVEIDTAVGPVIHVSGADLMNGTPIFDIKPYVPYADAHPEARGGFTDSHSWEKLEVEIGSQWVALLSPNEQQALRESLALDPRPHYHSDANRIYGMPFAGRDVRFRVIDGKVEVTEIVSLR